MKWSVNNMPADKTTSKDRIGWTISCIATTVIALVVSKRANLDAYGPQDRETIEEYAADKPNALAAFLGLLPKHRKLTEQMLANTKGERLENLTPYSSHDVRHAVHQELATPGVVLRTLRDTAEGA
jgi:hypothetical protein